MTRVLRIDPDHPDERLLAEAAEVLCRGGLAAFATETVYGLGADATNPKAVGRVFAAKGRPSSNPLIVHVRSIDQARACAADWPDIAEVLARRFWPGPLTLVLPRSALIPDAVTAGLDTVGVRMPATPVALGLIQAANRPLAAPSANRANRVSPTRAEHVLKDLEGRVEIVLDSGPTTAGIESTVVDLTRGAPYRVLRPGPITAERLSAAAGVEVVEEALHLGPARSPGQGPLHYAPRTPTIRLHVDEVASFDWPERGWLLVLGHEAPAVPASVRVFVWAGPEQAATALYDTLHRADAADLERIVIIEPPEGPAWSALRDRIARATSAR